MRRALLALALAGCAPAPIDVQLRVPVGQHPLASADQVWLSLADATGQTRLAREGAPSSDELELEGIAPASGYVLALQASFDGDVLASGRSCPFDLVAGAPPPTVPLYFALMGRFAPTASPSLTRTGAIAFVAGGQPVIAGGRAGGTTLANSDSYDARSGHFLDGPMLSAPRSGAQAVTLPDGTVLVLGGGDVSASGIETLSGGKSTPQPTPFPGDWIEGALVALPDGTALETGGEEQGGAPTSTASRITGGGTSVDSLTPLLRARARHTATTLGGAAGAAVVIAGGRDASGPVDAIELWTLAGGFGPSGALLTPRYDHTATLLANGLVLVVGGTGANGRPVAAAELIDPVQRISHPSGTLRTARAQHSATLLPSGRVLIAGGLGADGAPTTDVELFDPTLGTGGDFVAAQPLTTPRAGHVVLPLCDGTLLFVGGGDGAEIYTPL
jgi:hypothetical protein